jgi:23S rRNA (cytidine1920-2'-O)/16S rRNA (cytidine1409-2'-O)-methyltransferase
VAFISLDKILPAVKKLLAPDAFVLALIKPQFEAGKEHIGKKGVVRDPEVHKEVIRRIITLAQEEGFTIGGLDFSPVKGPEGNIEYLLYLTTGSGTGAGIVDGTQAGRDKVVPEVQNTALSIDIDAIVTASHAALDK